MSTPKPTSTLQRPAAHLLARFTLHDVGADTVPTYLEKGFSLAICCRNCPRICEWTPPMLDGRFGDRPDLPLQTLVSRLACTGEGGCGSHDIAVFPHFYDQPWTWAGPASGGNDIVQLGAPGDDLQAAVR